MGQDIHIRTSIWSKSEGKYINATGLSTSPQYSVFKPFFSGRYYEFFSLFGSGRGQFKPLQNGNYGIPDYLEKTYHEYLKIFSKDSYYGFVWFEADELENQFENYISCLKDPKKYFTEDDSETELITSGEFNFQYWEEETQPLIKTIEDSLQRIRASRQEVREYEAYSTLVDPDKVRYLIYFDS